MKLKFKILNAINALRVTRYAKGFTLIELVLTVAIIAITAFMVGPLLINAAKGYSLISTRRDMLSDTRLAINRMMAEIMLIPSTGDFVTWIPSEFEFNIPNESNIEYTLNGTDLERSGIVIASNVSSLTFSYLDAGGNPTAILANVKKIRVEMQVDAGTDSGTLTVRDQVFPRRFSSAYDGFE